MMRPIHQSGLRASVQLASNVINATNNPLLLWGRWIGRSKHVCCCNAQLSTSTRNIMFLGTPEVAADVLKALVKSCQTSEPDFQISAVVTQPPRPKGRGKRSVKVPSPVHIAAIDLGIPEDLIFTPEKAKDAAFLEAMRALSPDLCVTAAYGNMLPQSFLDIPRLGTLNVHPSLLPLYRGAAPVQRAVEDGVTETGVSVAYTVLRCDAGPVLAQQRVAVGPDEQAPELLSRLFHIGADLLLQRLPDVWAGRGSQMATPQDESAVVHAAKLCKEDGVLDWSRPAAQLHNRVRAYAGWPSTSAVFHVVDDTTGSTETVELKILETRLVDSDSASSLQESLQQGNVGFVNGNMLVPCGEGTVLEVLQVQPPMKKAISAKDYRNGLGKRRLSVRSTC